MIPKPIYEMMPVIYAGAGGYCLITLEYWTGKGAGLLLLSAAFLVFSLRSSYRRVSHLK